MFLVLFAFTLCEFIHFVILFGPLRRYAFLLLFIFYPVMGNGHCRKKCEPKKNDKLAHGEQFLPIGLCFADVPSPFQLTTMGGKTQ